MGKTPQTHQLADYLYARKFSIIKIDGTVEYASINFGARVRIQAPDDLRVTGNFEPYNTLKQRIDGHGFLE